MNLILNLLVAVQMLTALVMTGLILIQHGKGADMGAAFGSGSAGSLFGASGSANFLSRTTAVLAAVFFASTLMLAYFSHARTGGDSLLERAALGVPVPVAAPAAAASSVPQIPVGTVSSPSASTAASAPVEAASGAAQIPTK